MSTYSRGTEKSNQTRIFIDKKENYQLQNNLVPVVFPLYYDMPQFAEQQEDAKGQQILFSLNSHL